MIRKRTYQFMLFVILSLLTIFSIGLGVVYGETSSNPIDLEKINLGIPKEGTILYLDVNLDYIILGHADDRIDFLDHNYNYVFSFVFETYMRYSVCLDDNIVNIVHNTDPYIYKYNYNGQYLETIVDAELADEVRDKNISRNRVKLDGKTYKLITKLTKQYLVVETNESYETVLTIESRDFFDSILIIGIATIGGVLLLVTIVVFFMIVIKKINASYRKSNKEEEIKKEKQ